MKHKFAVHVLALTLLFCMTRLAYAATFAQEVRGADYESILTAAVAGLCGGAFKTIFTLASDKRAVFQILMEARRDLVVSFLAGGFVYLLMIMVESKWPGTVTREIRFGGTLIAGWAGSAVFVWAARVARSRLEAENERQRKGVPGDPPTSAAVPLESK